MHKQVASWPIKVVGNLIRTIGNTIGLIGPIRAKGPNVMGDAYTCKQQCLLGLVATQLGLVATQWPK